MGGKIPEKQNAKGVEVELSRSIVCAAIGGLFLAVETHKPPQLEVVFSKGISQIILPLEIVGTIAEGSSVTQRREPLKSCSPIHARNGTLRFRQQLVLRK